MPGIFWILNLLTDPVFWVLALTVKGLALRRWGWPRMGRICLWSAGGFFFVMFVSPLSIWLAQDLEYRYPVLDPVALPSADTVPWTIAVLGGGMTFGEDLTAADQLSGDALSRIAEGCRIYHQLDSCRIVTSGWGGQSPWPQARLLAETATDLGIPERDTFLLTRPRDTREEAKAFRQRFGDPDHLILVTSAIHMPRALGWFRHEGLDPIPAPANHVVKIDPDRMTFHWRPAMAKIGLFRKVCHEYAGLLELYWAGGPEGKALE